MQKKRILYKSQIVSKIFLEDHLLLLRFERFGLNFSAGQYLTLSLPGQVHQRDYSIFSSEQDAFFEVLISLNHRDEFNQFFFDIPIGGAVFFQGPFGDMQWQSPEKPHLFCAIGTGIAPFHAMVRSHPEKEYQLLLQMSSEMVALPLETFSAERVVRCVWPGDGGDFSGQIVRYIQKHPFPADTHFFLAGTYEAMLEISQLLAIQGFSRLQVHSDLL